MNPLLLTAIILSSLVMAVLLLGLYMICPGKYRREMDRFSTVKYAHRGLHDADKAENSLSAFRAAKEHGWGIELDVRLTKDGELVVFHDNDLLRMTGREGKVRDFTLEELSSLRLGGTSDGIPTFREVLELIDGAVPLLIEMKELIGEGGVAEKLVEVIDGYKGEYIVESFSPMALRRLRRLRPDILRGILSYEYTKEERHKGKIIFAFAEWLMLNFLMRPDFIAYDHRGYRVHSLRFIRRSFGTPLIAWTVRSEDEEAQAIAHGFDTVIFEGYTPEK